MRDGEELTSGWRRVKDTAADGSRRGSPWPHLAWMTVALGFLLLWFFETGRESPTDAATASPATPAADSFATLAALLSEHPALIETPMFETSPTAPVPIPVIVLEPTSPPKPTPAPPQATARAAATATGIAHTAAATATHEAYPPCPLAASAATPGVICRVQPTPVVAKTPTPYPNCASEMVTTNALCDAGSRWFPPTPTPVPAGDGGRPR